MEERVAAAGSDDRLSEPHSPKAARTLKRFVAAAKAVFVERGFLEVRIADIADRAGQSHGSFYYYFNSKEHVFRAVATAVDEEVYAPIEQILLAQSVFTAEQRIREALRRHFEACRREASILSLIERVAGYEPTLQAMRAARYRRYTERIADGIRQLRELELVDRQLDPDVTAAALLSLTARFGETWLVHRAIQCTCEQAVDQVTQIIVNALGLQVRAR